LLPLLLERAGVRRIKPTSYIPLIPTFSLKEDDADSLATAALPPSQEGEGVFLIF
jgi:hypothetical protein